MEDFEIISKLGEGAYSTVYKVKRRKDDNIYALKKVKLLNLSDKEKLNALNEVRILASVKSNFVISYKDSFFDEKDSTLGIVMEFADNGDLYQRIIEHKKSAKFLEETEIWRIFIQLVKGLKALHDLKILHRDLKSANVFMFKDGSAKLGDLNVSKVARKGLGYTQTGTPYYASPEVWKDHPYDNKSDIWSLGCVLYEMITLRPPFRAQNMEGLYNKVIKGQFNKIPERFSDELFSIVKLLLQVNSDLRPSCDKILRNPIIQKRIEFFKSYAQDDIVNEDIALIQTIKIPKNLLFLSDRLPGANYESEAMENTKNTNLNNNCSNSISNSNNVSKFNTDKNNSNGNIYNSPNESHQKNNDNLHSNIKRGKGNEKQPIEILSNEISNNVIKNNTENQLNVNVNANDGENKVNNIKENNNNNNNPNIKEDKNSTYNTNTNPYNIQSPLHNSNSSSNLIKSNNNNNNLNINSSQQEIQSQSKKKPTSQSEIKLNDIKPYNLNSLSSINNILCQNNNPSSSSIMNPKCSIQNINSSVLINQKNGRKKASNSIEIPEHHYRQISPKNRVISQNNLPRELSSNNIIINGKKYGSLPHLNSINTSKRMEERYNLRILKLNNLNGLNNNAMHNQSPDKFYKIYAPYLLKKNNKINTNKKFINNSSCNSAAYLNNLEKYYEQYNNYRRKNYNLNNNNNNNNINISIGINNKSGGNNGLLNINLSNLINNSYLNIPNLKSGVSNVSGSGVIGVGGEHKSLPVIPKRKLSPIRRVGSNSNSNNNNINNINMNNMNI